MAVCRRCGRKGLFVLVDADGLCSACRKDSLKASILHTFTAPFHNDPFEDLTPETYDGLPRSYHYTDVNPYVVWQYGGRYGKTCKSIGIRRGDPIIPRPLSLPDEPKNISLFWKDLEIAHMRSNRLRGMVYQWQENNLPILCKVFRVGGEENLLLEFAFYGKPVSSHAGSSAKKRTSLSPRTLRHLQKVREHFIAFDVETTGLNPEEDRIVELSAVRFVNGIPVDTFSSLIRQDRPIPTAAQAVNHISDKDLKHAPKEEKVLSDFCKFLSSSDISEPVFFVAHNASFDKAFVENALLRHGFQLSLQCEDTLKLSRKILPSLPKYTLSCVAENLQISQVQAHRATDDALVCGTIFIKLVEQALGCQDAEGTNLSL